MPNLAVERPVQTVTTWNEFLNNWDSPWTYRVGGEVFPYQVPATELLDVVEQGRRDPGARLWSGQRAQTLEKTDISELYRSLPLEDAVRHPVHMTLFDIANLAKPGHALEKVHRQVYQPLEQSFRLHGFTWERFYPILFLSGPDCHTNYHFDPGHVLIIQLHGRKRFHCLKEPLHWCPMEMRVNAMKHPPMPKGIRDEDVLTFELNPGDAIWSPMLTPHWVHAFDSTSYTLSISMERLECACV
jgi:hypothetical protein